MIMRKCKLIILEAIVAIVLLCTSVYAAVNVNLSFSVTTRKLNPGDEFRVRLTLNNIKRYIETQTFLFFCLFSMSASKIRN